MSDFLEYLRHNDLLSSTSLLALLLGVVFIGVLIVHSVRLHLHQNRETARQTAEQNGGMEDAPVRISLPFGAALGKRFGIRFCGGGTGDSGFCGSGAGKPV